MPLKELAGNRAGEKKEGTIYLYHSATLHSKEKLRFGK
jgi:hypothetical protein